MRVDFHYGMINILARLAGFDEKSAYIIAYSSQLVDDADTDNNLKVNLKINGINKDVFKQILTSHQAINLNNIRFEDQIEIWLLFHFLPSLEGNDFLSSMITKPNSLVAQKMFQIICENFKQGVYLDTALYLFGISLHVYADTWSHQDFNAFTSRFNIDYLNEKKFQYASQKQPDEPTIKKIGRWIAPFLTDYTCMGHADVGIDPDVPFLEWKFKKSGEIINIKNPDRYIEAIQKIFEQMTNFLNVTNGTFGNPSNIIFDEKVKMIFYDILSLTHQDEENVMQYYFSQANKNWPLIFSDEYIQKYSKYLINDWYSEAVDIDTEKKEKPKDKFEQSHWYLWQKAAMTHRDNMLNEIHSILKQKFSNAEFVFYNPELHTPKELPFNGKLLLIVIIIGFIILLPIGVSYIIPQTYISVILSFIIGVLFGRYQVWKF
jgi:hypothetical protein